MGPPPEKASNVKQPDSGLQSKFKSIFSETSGSDSEAASAQKKKGGARGQSGLIAPSKLNPSNSSTGLPTSTKKSTPPKSAAKLAGAAATKKFQQQQKKRKPSTTSQESSQEGSE